MAPHTLKIKVLFIGWIIFHTVCIGKIDDHVLKEAEISIQVAIRRNIDINGHPVIGSKAWQ